MKKVIFSIVCIFALAGCSASSYSIGYKTVKTGYKTIKSGVVKSGIDVNDKIKKLDKNLIKVDKFISK